MVSKISVLIAYLDVPQLPAQSRNEGAMLLGSVVD